MTRSLGLEGRILAKLDYLMPGFSKKDRAARSIIEIARADGSLLPEQTVVELTSGNMGTGLAIVCGILGHPFVAVMSAGNSVERARMMRALGAEVVIVPQASGSKPGEVSGADLALVDQEATRITIERDAFRADQFGHAGNPAAHETGTGPEIWDQSGGEITAFCDFAGSGGTLAGPLQDFCHHLVSGATRLSLKAHVRWQGKRYPRQIIRSRVVGYAMNDLVHMRDAPIADYLSVTGEEARQNARLLASREGIFAGYSAGANLAAAIQLLRGPERGGCVAIVMCDSGLKYPFNGLMGVI